MGVCRRAVIVHITLLPSPPSPNRCVPAAQVTPPHSHRLNSPSSPPSPVVTPSPASSSILHPPLQNAPSRPSPSQARHTPPPILAKPLTRRGLAREGSRPPHPRRRHRGLVDVIWCSGCMGTSWLHFVGGLGLGLVGVCVGIFFVCR